MTSFEILLPSNKWIILIGLLIGIAYSWVLYSKKQNWSNRTNIILSIIRFLLVTLLFIVLSAPFIKIWTQHIQKPIYAILIDNSLSMTLDDSLKLKSSLKQLQEMKNSLEGANKEVIIRTLDNTTKEILNVDFVNSKTNLTQAIRKIEEEFEGEHLVAITVLSDGIFNQGTSPLFESFKRPIYTIGVGDTIPKKDISFKGVFYNKVAYTDNNFPIVCELRQKGFDNLLVTVLLKLRGQIVGKQVVNLSSTGITKVQFEHKQALKGTYHYQLEILPTNGEYTLKNNYSHVYIEVVDTKDKVLILAAAPHPDIKALKSTLETNDQLEVQTIISGITTSALDNNYSAAILVQLPNKQGVGNDIINKLKVINCPLLYVVGSATDLNQFGQSQNIISIIQKNRETDLVFGEYNVGFEAFKMDESLSNILSKLPPLQVPFGEYKPLGNAQTAVFQRIGSLTTSKPLFILGNQNNRKIGVIAGEGIWQWKLGEYQETGQNAFFNELINKTIQYLLTKEDKRKFRVFPLEKEVNSQEKVVFENEIFNEIFEKIYGNEIDLSISNETGRTFNYKYMVSEGNSKFELGTFEHGTYKYVAKTLLLGKSEKSEGYFTVTETVIEALNTTADHALLRELSVKNQGKFYSNSSIKDLSTKLLNDDVKGKVYSNEETIDIINVYWIFFIILITVSLEWGIRKYSGGY